MEEQTTTEPIATQPSGGVDVAIDNEGRALPQPEEEIETAASQTEEPAPVETPVETDAGEIDTPKQPDDDLAKWAANKGIEITSDSERKLAEMAKNSEKAMHTKAGEASQLQKTVVEQAPAAEFGDPLTSLQQEVQALKLEQNVRNFYQDHPDAKDMDTELATLVEQRPHLAGDLEALYAVAKVNRLDQQSDTLRKEGGRQALENLASRQQTATPAASATTSANAGRQITLDNVDRLIAQNGHDWYVKNRDEINQVLEGR